MTKFLGIFFIISGVLFIYYALKYPAPSKNFQNYYLVRGVGGGILLILTGLLLLIQK